MSRDYSDYPERESRHIVKNERNDYQDKFFHDIDLDFLLDAIMNIELEGYTLNIVNNKLQLLDNDGDVVSEVDISQGSQGPVGPTPNISMNASVDSNIGTPSVEIVKTGTAESPVFSLIFHNLKGQKGDQGESIVGPSGQDGITPVVSATASVDSNTGIPGVTVTKTGTTENPIFNFAFTNIKGATGAASTVPGPQGEPGTPFQVKAQYDTWADFIAAHPTGQVGDAYQVGSNDEYYTKSEVNTIVGNIRQVPAIAAGDAGKVLSVNSGETGTEWVTPSGGGGAVVPTNWNNGWFAVQRVYDSSGNNLLYDRANGGTFTFQANETYILLSEVQTIPGKEIFYNQELYGNTYLYGAAIPEATSINVGTETGKSNLNVLEMNVVTPIPNDIDVSWYSPFNANTNANSASIRLFKKSTHALNTVINEVTFVVYCTAYMNNTFTWDPSQDWGGNWSCFAKNNVSYKDYHAYSE